MSAGWVRVIGASVRGAAHCRTGRPNQDSIAWLPGSGVGDRVVMAVSDGHGGAASPRSRSGSRLAVDVATKVLWGLPQTLSESALSSAIEQIAADWRAKVETRLVRRPLGETELAEAERRGGPGVRQLLLERPLVAYGATLLFAIVDSDYMGLGQLGDGDVLLVAGDGQVHRPLPADQRLLAHVTTSLCDENPGRDTRWALLPADPALVLLATDGYANSFANDRAFLQVGADLLDDIRRSGIEEVGRSLPRWLRETTREGAGDDITVGLAVLPDHSGVGGATRPHRDSASAHSPSDSSLDSSQFSEVVGITAIILGLIVIIAGLILLGRPLAVQPVTRTSGTPAPTTSSRDTRSPDPPRPPKDQASAPSGSQGQGNNPPPKPAPVPNRTWRGIQP